MNIKGQDRKNSKLSDTDRKVLTTYSSVQFEQTMKSKSGMLPNKKI